MPLTPIAFVPPSAFAAAATLPSVPQDIPTFFWPKSCKPCVKLIDAMITLGAITIGGTGTTFFLDQSLRNGFSGIDATAFASATAAATSIVVGDLDKNGTLDVVVGNGGTGGAKIYLNSGNGTSDVGKTVDATVRNGVAYSRSLALPIVLIVLGLPFLILPVNAITRRVRQGRSQLGQ